MQKFNVSSVYQSMDTRLTEKGRLLLEFQSIESCITARGSVGFGGFWRGYQPIKMKRVVVQTYKPVNYILLIQREKSVLLALLNNLRTPVPGSNQVLVER